jgi:alpha-L-arabinofuranosidase
VLLLLSLVAVSVVRDSKRNDLIVKIVNLLTVAVNTKVDCEGMGSVNSAAIRNVLTRAPDDKNARPITDKITIDKDFQTS